MRTVFSLIVVAIFLITCEKDQKLNGSVSNEKDTLKVVNVQTVLDSVISYGNYPKLPSQIDLLMSDSSFRSTPIKWNTNLNPTSPDKYRVVGYYNIKQNNNDIIDSIVKNVEVRDTEFQPSTSNRQKVYLCQSYSDTGNFAGKVIDENSMTYYEKNIDKIQYTFRVIESDEERLNFLCCLKCFSGYNFKACQNYLPKGQIEIFICFIYRYNTLQADGPIQFDNKTADSLYISNPEIFKMLYGKMYSCETTLGRFYYYDLVIEPKSTQIANLEKNLDKLKKSLDIGSDQIVDFSAFNINDGSFECSTPLTMWAQSAWPGKSIKHCYSGFKNIVDSLKTTTDEYNTFSIKYRSYYPK